MLLEFDFENQLNNNVLQNEEVTTFVQELENNMSKNDISTYQDYDERNFTRENGEKLYDEQQIVLKEMRREGAIYKITHLEDDCEDWRTKLIMMI